MKRVMDKYKNVLDYCYDDECTNIIYFKLVDQELTDEEIEWCEENYKKWVW